MANRRNFQRQLLALVACGLAPGVHAQGWPAKPVTLIAPYPPGGGVDAVARLLAERLAPRLGQVITVDKGTSFFDNLMEIYKWNMDAMGPMAKGEEPFDKARFAALAKDLAGAAQLDLLSGFPKGSDQGDTEAKPEVWQQWDQFKAKYGDFQKATGELSAAAAGGDLEAIKPKLGAVGKACKSCHEQFRQD